VPFYNLPKLHKILIANPEFAKRIHITRGYSTGLVKECFSECAPLLPNDVIDNY
jgi:hypothetical protein